MFTKKRMKPLATLLTLAMVASAVPVSATEAQAAGSTAVKFVADDAATGSAASGSAASGAATTAPAPTASAAASGSATSGAAATTAPGTAVDPATSANLPALQKVLKDNEDALYTLAANKSLTINLNNFKVNDELAAEVATAFAGSTKTNVKYNSVYNAKADAYILYTLAKKSLNAYIIDDNVEPNILPETVSTIKKVKEVKNAKKGKITVKQVKGKTTNYITYKFNGKKLKKTAIYTQKGSTYKKGAKKITKAAFNKYVKKYKKLKNFVKNTANKNATTNYYGVEGTNFYSNNLYWSLVSGSTICMRNDATDANDPYKVYSADSDGSNITRYILGPNANDANGVNYQKKIWDNIVKRQVTMMTVPFYGDIATGGAATVTSVSVTSGQDYSYLDGKTTVKTTAYDVILAATSTKVRVFVHESGANQGKIVAYEIGDSAKSYSSTIFEYKYDEQYDGQWMDPLALSFAYGDPAGSSFKTRSLAINYEGTNSAIKSWTVTATENVQFAFPDLIDETTYQLQLAPVTGFYWKKDATTTKNLPIAYNLDDPDYLNFGDLLNKESKGVYSADASVANSIYWKEY